MSMTPYHGRFGRQEEIFGPLKLPLPIVTVLPSPLPWAFSERNRIEYEETPDKHVFRVRIEGKEDALVHVEDGRMLHISARAADKEERREERGYYRVERSCREFHSKFKLPQDAKVDHLTSLVKDGVLTVTVPRDKNLSTAFHRV